MHTYFVLCLIYIKKNVKYIIIPTDSTLFILICHHAYMYVGLRNCDSTRFAFFTAWRRESLQANKFKCINFLYYFQEPPPPSYLVSLTGPSMCCGTQVTVTSCEPLVIISLRSNTKCTNACIWFFKNIWILISTLKSSITWFYVLLSWNTLTSPWLSPTHMWIYRETWTMDWLHHFLSVGTSWTHRQNSGDEHSY